MSRIRPPAATLLAMLCLAGSCAWGEALEQLVFGSFRSEDNAARWAAELGRTLHRQIHVERVHREDGVWYRVRTGSLGADERAVVEAAAAAR